MGYANHSQSKQASVKDTGSVLAVNLQLSWKDPREKAKAAKGQRAPSPRGYPVGLWD